ncbi:hypothetical protein [Actinoplanes sp. NPDC049681]|uniref:hypothetical protein n=1 Tax=Actinoplanes sp. NPDC049681 TaxID=3363905 RepID=UPI0037A801A2
MHLVNTRALRVALASVLLAAGLGVVAASPAHASDDCIGSSSPHANGDGSGIVLAGNWHLKKAPYSTCDNTGVVLHGGEIIWWQCQRYNIYGHLWFYVRVGGTNNKGWISTDNFVAQDLWDDNGNGVIDVARC